MKRNVLLAAMMLTAGSLLAADPKDDVTGAAKKLADAPNYSWKQTTENAAAAGGGGGGGRGGFGGGPVEGKADKDGLVYRKMSFGQNDFEIVNKGTNGAFNGQDGWQTFADMAAANGGGGGGGGRRGGGLFGQAPATPAQQAQDLLKQVKELKEFGGAYVGDLTEEGAKAQASPQFGGRRGGGAGGGAGGGGAGGGGFTPPEVTGAKGSVKFWVKDGVLSKYELKIEGKTTNFQGDPVDINRTTTVEIKDVGNTKIEIPDDIKKKLS